ncbi:MAG: HAD-IC family P-type ATPase [Candidatus Helarchaeota archaeon]|nr:HAD-IC family P-type ATPase [Candidatus Helarchaeota archaeon]
MSSTTSSAQQAETLKYEIPYHSRTVERVIEDLDSNLNGLSEVAAEQRFQIYGPNELPEKKRKHPIFIFLRQFHNVLTYVLLVAALISLFSDHLVDVYIIVGVIVINGIMGFIQENKAERAIQALKKLIVPYAKVFRDGELKRAQSRNLVPGDIILLEDGDRIPADARLIEVKNFRTIEASQTGESFPVDKDTEILPANTLLADRKNMVWMGTFVASGQAKAIISGTGIDTSISKIAEAIEKIKRGKGHLEQKVSKLVKQVGIIAIGGALVTFLVAFYIRGIAFIETFSFTLASLVSAIPEGLPIVLVIVLSIGASRMARKCAIVRRLPAVETLDATTLIATDKTGTLTQNTMNIQKILLSNEDEITVTGQGWEPFGEFLQKEKIIRPLENPRLAKLLHIAAICNNARLLKADEDDESNPCFTEVCACMSAQDLEHEEAYRVIGDPTEASLVVVGEKAGFYKDDLLERIKLLDSMPFNPAVKYRASLIRDENQEHEIYVVGAPEVVINHSKFTNQNGETRKLTHQDRQGVTVQVEHLAEEAMRVLGLAYRKVSEEVNTLSEGLITDLVFVGIVGLMDPLRIGVGEAIARTKKAGIRVIMQTGDHRNTAIAIAKKIGLIDEIEKSSKHPSALTESELVQMPEEVFEDALQHVSVFARMSPEMKLRTVKKLQKLGHIVAMTGDGVNDAPALKQADIGISMGIIGTEVAREASEVVLADDNFATIVDAVIEGRIIFTNIRRTTTHLITTSISEDVTVITSLLMGLPLPLLPIHILWLNLVTDGTGDIALATEPGHGDVLEEPPRKGKENILSKDMYILIIMFVIIMSIGDIFLFSLYYDPLNHDATIGLARTVAFLSMMFSQLFNLWNMRSTKKSIFKLGVFTNKFVNLDFIISIGFVVLVLYIPVTASIFSFVPLGWAEWLLAIAVSSCVLWFGELYKYLKRRIK